MTDHARQPNSNRPLRRILRSLGTIIAGALLLLWAWNTLATDLFNLPAVQFKHALALELGLLAIYMTHHSASSLRSWSHRDDERR